MRTFPALLSLLWLATSGCYRYRFELQQEPPPESTRLVTYEERVPTYLNGFVGTGRVETARYCEHPVRTELEVTAPPTSRAGTPRLPRAALPYRAPRDAQIRSAPHEAH
jgi:hypothetical protein